MSKVLQYQVTNTVPESVFGSSPPAKGTRAKAVYDFVEEQDGDLGFRQGDAITILKADKSGWWVGEKDGRTGIFPFNYVVPE